MTTAQTGTNRDKQGKSFVESPTRGPNQTAQEVFVGNGYANPIPVDGIHRGKPEPSYGQINSVAVDVETLIVTKTIAAEKGYDLTMISCTGDNIARYVLKINDNVVEAKRSWWSGFNVDMTIPLELVAGDKIEVFVTNKGKTLETFESTIKGSVYDV